MKDKQWITPTNSKKTKGKTRASYAISILGEKDQSGTTPPTNSGIETTTMATRPNEAGLSDTQFRKNYLKDCSKVGPISNSAEAPGVSPTKQKELPYQKDSKNDSVTIGVSFRFDVLAQLANIFARITLYEFLQLSKVTKDALIETLADSKTFLTQIAEPSANEKAPYPSCHQTQKIPHITFSPEDMQVKNLKYNIPLYYSGYVGSIEVS